MKKKFLIGATILAMVLSFTVLGISVYAVVNQSVAVKNTISFAGKTNNLHFIIDGRITGTKNDSDPKLGTRWEYDYETMGLVGHEWNVGSIEFASEGLTVEEINITYTFQIQNLSSYPMEAKFNGPGELVAGLNKNYYVYKLGMEQTEASQIQINRNETATMVLKLTLDNIKDFSCNENINFAIEVTSLETV